MQRKDTCDTCSNWSEMLARTCDSGAIEAMCNKKKRYTACNHFMECPDYTGGDRYDCDLAYPH
jgi:hypothetical protein